MTSETRRRFGAWGTAAVLGGVYCAAIWTWAVNAPRADEWDASFGLVAKVHAGTLRWGDLWQQHFESRMVVPNAIVALSAKVDHWNIRHLIELSAILMVAAYVLLIHAAARYLATPPRWSISLIIGIPFLSFGDAQTALWGFQLEWFLVIACLAGLLFVLSSPRVDGWSEVALVVVLCSVATLSSIQGILLWPLALGLIAWPRGEWRGRATHLTAIFGAGILLVAIYLIGYSQTAAVALCPPHHTCSLGNALGQPLDLGRYSLRLVGIGLVAWPSTTILHKLVGILLLGLCIPVVITALRERSREHRLQVPLALIAFALGWDVAIALGRVHFGNVDGSQFEAYVTPQVLLLTGLSLYGADVVRRWRSLATTPSARWRSLGGMAIVGIVVVASIISTIAGVSLARTDRHQQDLVGRLAVNLSERPSDQHDCYDQSIFNYRLPGGDVAIWLDALVTQMRQDHVAMFGPGQAATFRTEGFPFLNGCKWLHDPGST